MVRDLTGKHPGYYEAILQLRDLLPEIIEFAKQEIKKVNLRIAKTVKMKNGVDYYLTDTALTRSLGRQLQEKFGGELKFTASLFGQKDGRDIYRTTVLFRGIHFKKGDNIEYKGEKYTVKALGKEMMLQQVKTGKKVHLKYKDMKSIKLL